MAEKDKREPLHPEEKVVSFFLVRHGHTKPTETGHFYTDPSTELTDRGREQASNLSPWIGKKNPNLIICSKALRVVTTASLISEPLGMTPEPVDGFDEWRIGDWSGLSYWDIKEQFPSQYKAWSDDPIGNVPPNGESIVQFCERISANVSDLTKKYDTSKVVFVTHAGVIRAILCHALELSPRSFWRLSIPTASVSRVDFSESFATVHYTAFRLEET